MTGPNPDERKVSSLRDLPQSIGPGRDLWPQIAARLGDMPGAVPGGDARAPGASRRPVQLRWLAVAAMVASVAVGIWIGRASLPITGSTPITAQRAPGAAPGSAALDVAYVNDPRYQRQRAALLGALQTQLASLPPQTRTKVTASLATIEKAKQDLEQALGEDPGNALLQELLVNTYQDEMRVLTDVREASEPGRGI
jgi:hypothetical protein